MRGEARRRRAAVRWLAASPRDIAGVLWLARCHCERTARARRVGDPDGSGPGDSASRGRGRTAQAHQHCAVPDCASRLHGIELGDVDLHRHRPPARSNAPASAGPFAVYVIDPSLFRAATPQENVRLPAASVSASTNHWSARSTTPACDGLVAKFMRHAPSGGTTSSPDVLIVALIHVAPMRTDRKSTRLNSSHANISYAVFCLKKKKKIGVGREVFDRRGSKGGREG